MAKRPEGRRHGDTEAPLEGFEGRLQGAFEWMGQHPRWVLSVLGGLVLVGAVVAGAYEYAQRSRDEAAIALAEVEDRFVESMGGESSLSMVHEPANPDVAARSREEALAGLEAFIAERSGSRAARLASLRAAEMETDLGQHALAEARLRELADDLGSDDPMKAVTLRLLAYVLEEQARPLEAGETYAQAAAIDAYPDSAALWLAAGDAFRRGGDPLRAREAYREVISADPEFAAQRRIEDFLALVEPQAAAEAPDLAGEPAPPES